MLKAGRVSPAVKSWQQEQALQQELQQEGCTRDNPKKPPKKKHV